MPLLLPLLLLPLPLLSLPAAMELFLVLSVLFSITVVVVLLLLSLPVVVDKHQPFDCARCKQVMAKKANIIPMGATRKTATIFFHGISDELPSVDKFDT